MAKVTIDGKEVTCPDGVRLVEVAKAAGAYMSNLCYIDGLPPYAGCRTCLVEVEGGRGLQLACTTPVTDGMIVRTTTNEVQEGRRAVLSIILANHSDRCLTCHRREHCHPGDICLRDDVVTHRCVTCPKNYRCELQATCELVGMSQYEPWEGEARSFYAVPEHAPADRANPFLEFDPKMCIICTRCVRACDELRHTGAITLAGRGYSTRIAFGAGGRIDESNCDFCGACIDVCPTATLLESPHKWISRPDQWVETVCSYCSVGCTIKLATKDGRGVMVRPSRINPVSWDQICVRGRYHYDALKARDYLRSPLVRRGDVMAPVSWDDALDATVTRLREIIRQSGPESVGVLVSPLAVNEEAYTAQKLARAVIGTANIDFTGGVVTRATGAAVRGAFGTEVLPADMTDFRTATHILVIAEDLEATHPVAALRLKDAVMNSRAKAAVIATRWGEMADFGTWVQIGAGRAAATVAALAAAVAQDPTRQAALRQQGVGGVERVVSGSTSEPSADGFDAALAMLRDAAGKDDAKVAIVFAPNYFNAWMQGEIAKAAANLAIVVCGPERAPASLFILPTDANVTGLRDLGVAPDVLPGYHRPDDGSYRGALESAWGARLPQAAGLGFAEMMAAARDGRLKALLVVGDNPLLTAPDKPGVRGALESLELLVAVDAIMTDTAELAQIVLPDVDVYGKEGSYTPADRRVIRRNAATLPQGSARPALVTLAALGNRLAKAANSKAQFSDDAEQVMNEIATVVPLYAGNRYADMLQTERQSLFDGAVPKAAKPQFVPLGDLTAGPTQQPGGNADALGLALLIGRGLYTSVEAASLHKKDADKLHREEYVEINDADAARSGIADGDELTLQTERGNLRIKATVNDHVPPGTAFVPLLYNGGAVTALLGPDEDAAGPVQVRVRTGARV